MPSLLEIGLANSVCAAALAVIALAVGRVCRKPALLHGLWLLVLIKLVTPPLFPLPVPVLPAEEAKPVAQAPEPKTSESILEPAAEPALITQMLLLPSPEEGQAMVAVKISENWSPVALAPSKAPAPAPAVEPPAPRSIDRALLLNLVTAVWLAGAGIWFLVASVKLWRFQRLLRHGQPASAELLSRAADLAGRMGLKKCPQLALLPGPVPPLLLWLGFGRPTIYLPGDLIGKLDAAEVETLLAHELAHLCRRDHWVRWLEFVVQGVCWWNPLVPLARRAIQGHEEECCDALVVGVLPARSYAAAIVRTLDFLAGAEPLPAAACGLRRVASLKRRLTRIIEGGSSGRTGYANRGVLIALALATLPLLPTLARTAAVVLPAPPVTEELALDDGPSADDAADAVPAVDGAAAPRAVAASPDGARLALALEDLTIEIRDAKTGALMHTLTGHAGPVNGLAWSPDGATLASGSSDRTVKLWDAATGRLTATLKGHAHWVYAIAFSPDGKALASGGYDRTVRLWNPATGRTTAVLRGHDAAVRALAFAPDGKTLASGGGDRSVRLWDVATRRLRSTLSGHTETVRAVAFSPDGRTLASGGEDGSARLWDARTGAVRAKLSGHAGEVTSLAFAPWGPVLATGGPERVLRLWDVGDGRLLGRLPASRDGVMSLAFAGDGALAALGPDGQLRQMPLSRVSMRAGAKSREMAQLPAVKIYRKLAAAPALEGYDGPRMILLEFVRED